MNTDSEWYLMNKFLESKNYQVWIPDILLEMREKFNVSDKQVYYTLQKWSRKNLLDSGTSLNGPWLTLIYNREPYITAWDKYWRVLKNIKN